MALALCRARLMLSAAQSVRRTASSVPMASCARRGTPSSSVFAPASDVRASALPFPAPASGQITPMPRLFAPALSKKASTLPLRDSTDGQKSPTRGVRSFGIGANNFGAGAFCSGVEPKSLNAAALPLHRRAKNLAHRVRSSGTEEKSSVAGACRSAHGAKSLAGEARNAGAGAVFLADGPPRADASARRPAPVPARRCRAPVSGRDRRV